MTIRLEALEERIALSTVAMSGVHAKPLNAAPAIVALLKNAAPKTTPPAHVTNVETSSVAVGSNGDVTVTAADGGSATYQKVASGWRLIVSNRPEPMGWLETSWDAGGKLVLNVSLNKTHDASGQISQLIVQGQRMTYTQYHAVGYPIYWGLGDALSKNATVTWIYQRRDDGGVGWELEYHVDENNSSWAADWKNPNAGLDLTGYYATGWKQWYPWYENASPFPAGGSDAWIRTLRRYLDNAGLEQHRGQPTVAEPPGATVQSRSQDGLRTETVWNTAHTQSITFVYGGPAQDTLIEQTYGNSVGGKWVTTTDHSPAFITQAQTYDKPGGKLETSVTTRKAANGQTVTFNGTWTSGTALNNATGIETATNDLGFSSVTVQYQNGTPVERYGLLQRYLGGLYATDTFDGSGESVIKRQISSTKGGPVLQTWTGSGRNLTISQNDPSSDIKLQSFKYEWDPPHANRSGFTLLNYDATFVQPVDLNFYDRKTPVTVKSTTYAWWAFASYNQKDKYWDWNYRERGQTGGDHNADISPNPQAPPYGKEPTLDDYWNKV